MDERIRSLSESRNAINALLNAYFDGGDGYSTNMRVVICNALGDLDRIPQIDRTSYASLLLGAIETGSIQNVKSIHKEIKNYQL